MDRGKKSRFGRAVAALAVVSVLTLAGEAAGETIELVTGDRIVAPIVEDSDHQVVVEHAVLGRLVIPRDSISSIIGLEHDTPVEFTVAPLGPVMPVMPVDPAAGATTDDAPPTPAPRPLSQPGPIDTTPDPPKHPWKSRLELGVSGNSGSTENVRAFTSIRTERAREADLARFDGTYRYTASRGDSTENRLSAGAYGEWFRDRPRWSVFAQARADLDKFQPWDWRLTGGGGVGYRIFEVKEKREDGTSYERFAMSARLGGGARREFGVVNPEIVPEGLVAGSFTLRINGSQTLTGESTYYPDLGDREQFRTVSKLDWVIALPDTPGVNFKLGVLHEYEAENSTGIERDDLSAYASLVFEF